jgi:hypothetical protein
MMIDVDVLIFGSGSLTRAVVMAIAGCAMPGTSIMLAGRNESVVASMAMLARARVVDDGAYRCVKTSDEIERTTGIQIPEALLTWRADALEEQARRLESLRQTLDQSSEHAPRGESDAPS